MKISHKQLLEYLHYNPDSGQFTWLKKSCKKVMIGNVAGCSRGNGYQGIKLLGCSWSAHRLAWFYVHKEWPAGEIDHRNGMRSDNRLSNLRDVTTALNRQNLHGSKRGSSTGFLGVKKTPLADRFQAGIRVNKKFHYLGTYNAPLEAHEAYLAAKRKLHPANTL